MQFDLLTRNECQAITQTSEAFFCTTIHVEGQVVELYNYRLASINDFVDNKAFELRGLCFVLDRETYTWSRNILLNKFFNINQTIGWMYDEVKDKKIVRVQNKEDGSVISFIRFKNGNIRAKSKMSFESPQAVMAQEFFMGAPHSFRKFVTNQLNIGNTPVFELVSPDNQIVLEYIETGLKLLQVRKSDGSYLPAYNMEILARTHEVATASDFPIEHPQLSLDALLKQKATNQDSIEGWVVTFEDGQMAKIKTDKYLSLHGLIGPDAFRENLLVKTILDGNIDDVISALVPGVKRDKLVEMSSLVEADFNHLVVEFKELRRKYFQDFKEDRKSFAIAHRTAAAFGGVMKTLNNSFRDVEQVAEEQVKHYILKQCKTLGDAKDYTNKLRSS
jgi:T4 RnlA family RNA ligase